jgi:pimeloyl-ACP methyl ester carboxylesterase
MTNKSHARSFLIYSQLFIFIWIHILHGICYGETSHPPQTIRNRVVEKFPEQTRRIMERYGLTPHGKDSGGGVTPGRPAVILVYGLDEPGKVWMNLAPALLENGHAVWLLLYPNDQPIRVSAKFFLEEIRAASAELSPELIIVAHSMGGLVAREMLTAPALHYQERIAGEGLPRVRQLIMVGTPNHGSQMAHFRVLAELREQVVHMVKGEYHWLLPIMDGTGEAGIDLLPESEFLAALNSRKHPENIDMRVIAGIMNPLQTNDARQTIEGLLAKLSPDRKASVHKVAAKINGVFNEMGDGAVSLASARLAGIPLETVSGTHLSIIRNISRDSNRVPPALPIILRAIHAP